MKLSKLTAILLITAMACTFVTSCSKDDTDETTKPQQTLTTQTTSESTTSATTDPNSSQTNSSTAPDPSGETSVTEYVAAIADGYYECAVYGNTIINSGTSTSVSVDIKENVSYDDTFVNSLSVGDVLSLNQYGYDDITVTSIDRVQGTDGSEYITLNDYEVLLVFNSRTHLWVLTGASDSPYSYIVASITVVLADDCVIMDGFTPIVTSSGNTDPVQIDDMETFFSSLGSDYYYWSDITITNGYVTSINFNFHP